MGKANLEVRVNTHCLSHTTLTYAHTHTLGDHVDGSCISELEDGRFLSSCRSLLSSGFDETREAPSGYC